MNEATAQILRLPMPSRRFQTADLSQHGKWIVPRFLKTFPMHDERSAATFLSNVLTNNEYCFLYQDSAVALFQVVSSHSLEMKPIVWERMVWVENREDQNQVRAAADFYVEVQRWAKHLGAEVVIVEENTDVPHDMVAERLGRVFERKQKFARV